MLWVPLSILDKNDKFKIRVGALSAVVARFVHIEEVRGPIPLVPTVKLFFGQQIKTRKAGEKRSEKDKVGSCIG